MNTKTLEIEKMIDETVSEIIDAFSGGLGEKYRIFLKNKFIVFCKRLADTAERFNDETSITV